jgi:hypothetical protein
MIKKILSIISFLCLAGLLKASTISVINSSDSGSGSLRQAISDAVDGDIISIDIASTIFIASELPTITQAITINGNGLGTTISGNNASRIFTVQIGTGTVTFNSLNIINAKSTNSNAAGLFASTYTNGLIAINNCTFSGCSTTGYGAYGGAIATSADMNLTNCTIYGNSAEMSGGALATLSDCTLAFLNCTIYKNDATSISGTGGLDVTEGTVISIQNTILAGNTAESGTSYSDLLASDSDQLTSLGNNLSNTTPFSESTDLTSKNLITEIMLSDLAQDVVSGMLICALQDGSIAINQANTTNAPSLDQCGQSRIGNADLGAYENQTVITAEITTLAVSDIGTETATGNGNITDLGASNPTAHGVCWNTSGTPTTSDSKTEEGAASATGAFTTSITSLSANTLYYVRAYATNTAGTSYGAQVSFTTQTIPTITTNNGLKLNEGTTKTIPLDSLESDDIGTENSTLTYTVTSAPSNGQLENTDNTGVSISTFTQQNLIDDKIQYVHDGSNTTSDAFTFKVSNGINELTGQTFSITVVAVDDDTPTIVTNNGLQLNEGATKTIPLDSLEADDSDTDNSTLTYTVTSAASNGQLENTDNSGVSISTFTQQNLIDDKIQYVHDGSNTTFDVFTFKISDGTPNELTGQTFNITVVAVDDDTPTIVTNNGLKLNEGATKTIPLDSLEADDSDTDNSTLTYTVTSAASNGQLENTDNSGVSISTFTQQNLIDDKIQYVHDGSESSSDSFVFKVADGSFNEFLGQTFHITVNPINDNIPVVTVDQTYTVAENIVNSGVVGTVLATDADEETTFSSWTISSGNTNSVFAIDASSGEITVADNSNLDFETTELYTLGITVSDGENTSLVETVNINVNDINEAPTAIQLSNSSIAENSAVGSKVGALSATDIDADQIFTYTIVENDNFEIVGDSLFSKSVFDFEIQNSYELEITVTDQDDLSYSESFTIQITDANEAPTGIQLSNASIAENLAIGSEVGALLASDEDADQSFIFTIAENDNFEISGDKLISSSDLDFETQDSYSVEITVTDQGDLSYSESFTIQITDANEAPEFLSDPVLEATSGETYLYEIEYQDVDQDGCIVSLESAYDWLTFTDYGDGNASLSGAPEEAGIYSISLKAADSEFSVLQEFEITVATVTGIEDLFSAPEVSIYPNPVANELHVDLSDFYNADFVISLHSMSGAKLYSESYETTGGEAQVSFSLQALSSGFYFLLIESDDYQKSYKIVKL